MCIQGFRSGGGTEFPREVGPPDRKFGGTEFPVTPALLGTYKRYQIGPFRQSSAPDPGICYGGGGGGGAGAVLPEGGNVCEAV